MFETSCNLAVIWGNCNIAPAMSLRFSCDERRSQSACVIIIKGALRGTHSRELSLKYLMLASDALCLNCNKIAIKLYENRRENLQ